MTEDNDRQVVASGKRPGSGKVGKDRTKRGLGWSRRVSLEGLAPYLFILPVLAFMGVFIYWPLLYSVYLSTLEWNFISPTREFVGLGNFVDLAGNPDFRQALLNTGGYMLIFVPVLVLAPLGLALLLWPVRRSRAQTVYRGVLFAPTVVSFAAAAVVWLWIFNPLAGVLNQFITAMGGANVNWLNNPTTAFWSVIAVSAWKALGFNLLLYLAALEAVPKSYLEAAAIDGANGWSLFWQIRLPMITPMLFFVLVTTIIFVNDELFAAIDILTRGGPSNATTNLLYDLYERGFQFFQIGAASATALIIFAAVMSVTWLQFRLFEGRVHYD